jgi:hypothetical protein
MINHFLNKNRSSVFTVSFLISIFILFILCQSACNEPFQAVGDDEAYTFFIYGYLDASADTQWVRVTPAHDQLETPDELPRMHVTLTHLESGTTVIMNDSLILSPDGRHSPVVWTTMDIEPEQLYRLKAERPDGAVSHVTVTTPPDFPTPVLIANEQSVSGDLLIEGVERVADVQSVWKNYGRVHYRRFVRRSDGKDNAYIVSFRIGRDLGILFDEPPPGLSLIGSPRQIFVVSGGPEWNEEIPSMNDLIYNLPASFSNVEGGVGYLIGIVGKTIPFKGCFNDEGQNIACPTEQPFNF